MHNPEYYEHVRLRDVFTDQSVAIEAMITTVGAQRKLLLHIAAFEDTSKAGDRLADAAVSLVNLREKLQKEIKRHTAAIGETA